MSEFELWQITPAVAAGLDNLGWTASAVADVDALVPIVRGTSVVTVLPPVPATAAPIAAALLSGLSTRGGRALVLTAPALVGEWGATMAAISVGTHWRIEAARGPARAARRIRADDVDVLIAAPETALTLLTRSALGPDAVTTIVMAWPEDWDADEAVTVLLQDLPKDAQRIVLTARPEHAAALVERYARRALIFGTPSANLAAPSPALAAPRDSARTLATSWPGRATAVAELIDATDPADATIWTVDNRDHALIRLALGGGAEGVRIVMRGAPVSGAVICYDPPSGSDLPDFIATEDLTVLVPPGTEGHVARIITRRRPVQGATSAAALLTRDVGLRSEITREIAGGTLDAPLYALGPLFERHEPQTVAAAVFALWRRAVATATPNAGSSSGPLGGLSSTPVGGIAATKIWVGVGKKDEATVGDLVAVLVKELGVDRTLIGRIELRDTFALVEVPEADAERIAARMTGLTIRRRKLVARVDRGPGESRGGFGGPRGAPRGGGASRPSRGERG